MKLDLNTISEEPPKYANDLYDDVCVVGSHRRMRECEKFLEALTKMRMGKDRAGAFLVAEPENEYDENAIKVRGFVTKKRFAGGGTKTYHIGYIPKSMAYSITKNYDDAGKLFVKLLEFNHNPKREYPISIIIDILEK